MQGFGAPREVVESEAEEGEKDAQPFEVHEDNWLTVLAFCSLCTSWRIHYLVGEKVITVYQGLRYEAFPTAAVIVGAKLRQRQEIYAGLRVMEKAACDVLNERDSD